VSALGVGRVVLRGLFITGRTLIGGPIGILLFIPDLLSLADWLARKGFGVELCLSRTAGDWVSSAWDFLFAWTDPATLRNKYERLVMCTAMFISMHLPPPGLEWLAIGEFDPANPDRVPLVLFTYEGRMWACGVMQLPSSPQTDVCGTIDPGPQFALFLQQASYPAYRDALPQEVRTRIEATLQPNADVPSPPPRGLQWYFPPVARMIGAQAVL
jgi:hypothetical protein